MTNHILIPNMGYIYIVFFFRQNMFQSKTFRIGSKPAVKHRSSWRCVSERNSRYAAVRHRLTLPRPVGDLKFQTFLEVYRLLEDICGLCNYVTMYDYDVISCSYVPLLWDFFGVDWFGGMFKSHPIEEGQLELEEQEHESSTGLVLDGTWLMADVVIGF